MRDAIKMSEKEYVINFQRWSGGEMDAVGDVIGFTYGGRWYAVLYTKAEMFRGNHTHETGQWSILLDGKGRYVFGEDGVNVDYSLKVGEPLFVPAGMPHILLPEEDCLTVEWWGGAFGVEEYDFPEVVDELTERLTEAKTKKGFRSTWYVILAHGTKP